MQTSGLRTWGLGAIIALAGTLAQPAAAQDKKADESRPATTRGSSAARIRASFSSFPRSRRPKAAAEAFLAELVFIDNDHSQ